MSDTSFTEQSAEDLGWSGMFVGPAQDPRGNGSFAGERALLVGYLRDQRLTLELKCADLDAAALARPSVEPSNVTLLGLVRHMAWVEQFWFRRVMAGEDVRLHYRSPDDPDLDFNGASPDAAVVAEARSCWRSEVAFAERFVADAPSLDITGALGEERVELRKVLVHLIAEYARHNGHADFLRERIDGRVGE
ncbi:mycothiol transferase [Streptomyces sp. DW26H14]|uniref:mycothiol transferase n=1 Tax=Streptomyces sp. DW26H14 TaxID=3435395 RepID=UPI00403DC4ED